MLNARPGRVGADPSLRRLALVVACALAVVLAAGCGGSDDDDSASGDTPAGTSADRCGDPDQLTDLNFYNWADYIDPAILDMFTEECGVEVTMDTYTSNEELVARLQAGNSGYDLVIPTDYALPQILSEELAQPLDFDVITNEGNLDPQQMGTEADPDNTYSLPYQYGTTGIAYNAAMVDEPPTSWKALFEDNENCGLSTVLDTPHEAVGGALMSLGYDWNENSPDAHAEAETALTDARSCLLGFDSANFIGNLASGEVVMAESWSFAAGIARADNPDIQYVIPDEGGVIWQDNFVIPADAPHPYTANVFINYMLEPDISTMLTEFTVGFSPNLEVGDDLSDDYHDHLTEGGLEITDETRERLVPQKKGEGQEIFSETWSAVQAAG